MAIAATLRHGRTILLPREAILRHSKVRRGAIRHRVLILRLVILRREAIAAGAGVITAVDREAAMAVAAGPTAEAIAEADPTGEAASAVGADMQAAAVADTAAAITKI